MSQTRITKSSFPAKSLLTIILVAVPSLSYAAESIDQLATRIGMDHFREAIKKGDRNAFKTLPAKGYKNGLTGLLIKTNTYANPDDSFADCDMDTVFVSVKDHKTIPGCRISLKLASKDGDGSYHDRGIRVEYGIATDSKKFIANNSAWAQHVISGDKVLENELSSAKNETLCNSWATMARNIAAGRDNQDPQSMFDEQIEGLRGKLGITEQNIVFAHYIAHTVYTDLAGKTPKEAEYIIYNVCRKSM